MKDEVVDGDGERVIHCWMVLDEDEAGVYYNKYLVHSGH